MLFLKKVRKNFRKLFIWKTLLLLFLVSSCYPVSQTETWKSQYGYLEQSLIENDHITETEYYIVFLVAAYHLDYFDNERLVSSLINYGEGKRNIGHSWILLKGNINGRPFVLEGGQSGQLGKRQPRFYKGINNYIKYGYANPTEEQKRHPRYEPNPIKYLWDELDDGFFQKGSGGHRPTYAAKVDLTREQFKKILQFMAPGNYPYNSFSLVGHNCSSFIARIASLFALNLEHRATVKINPLIVVGEKEYRLWADPYYSEITFSTPDVIEHSLMKAVSKGEAEYALGWYFSRVAKFGTDNR